MRFIHNFGLNVIDLESIVKGTSLPVKKGRVEIPKNTLLVVHDLDGKEYYAKIKEKQEYIEDAGRNISIRLDEKYDLVGRLSSKKLTSSPRNELHIDVKEKSGGGGAHNAAYSQGVFLQGNIKAMNQGTPVEKHFAEVYKIKPCLHTMYGDPLIQDKLPPLVDYHPVCRCIDDAVGWNIILPIEGRKITLRSNPTPYDKKHTNHLKSHISKDDVLFVNTVKDNDYLKIAYKALETGNIGRCIVAATDSMIDKLGKKNVEKLVAHSDVYISNKDELKALTGITIVDNNTLVEAMDKVRELQLKYENKAKKKPHIYVTFGEAGAAAMDTSGNIFYQSCVDFPIDRPLGKRVKNTNGCGDAFAGIVATLETAGFPTIEILDYTNIAGQICTQYNGTVGNWLATPTGIADFQERYRSKPIMMYDRPQGDFVGGIFVNCRF